MSQTERVTTIDPKAIDPGEVYKLMIGAIVPRPIAWVSTCSKDGVGNLAPFSFFNGVARRPAMLMFVISAAADGTPKDTERNLLEVPEFVVNIVSDELIDSMVQSAANYPYGLNELEKVGLSARPSHFVRPTRVAESKINMECRVSKTISFGDGSSGSSTVIFGEILLFHISQDILDDRGRISAQQLRPVGRLGGADYNLLGEIVTKPVPKI